MAHATLTIHTAETEGDPYEFRPVDLDLANRGPASLYEAVRAEFDVLEEDDTLPYHSPGVAADRGELICAVLLLECGEYTDPGGVRWTLAVERTTSPRAAA
jgi:hypothetical protein